MKRQFRIRYDSQRKIFVFPRACLNLMFDKLEPYAKKRKVNLIGVPDFVFKFLEAPDFGKGRQVFKPDARRLLTAKGTTASLSDCDEEDEQQQMAMKDPLDRIPSDFNIAGLFDFQKDGVRYGISRGGRFLLGDEMGVGKTVQALAISYCFKSDWPLVIVCPASLKYNWKDECMRWIPNLHSDDVQIIESGKEPLDLGATIFIMSYDLATKRA
jgi:SNF2 family DNA or RNA helicase